MPDSDKGCWNRLNFLPRSMLDVLHNLFSTETCHSPTFLLLAFSSSLTMLGKIHLRILTTFNKPYLLLIMFGKPCPLAQQSLSAIVQFSMVSLALFFVTFLA